MAALVLAVSRCRVLCTYRDLAHPVAQETLLHGTFRFWLPRRPREYKNINEREHRLRQPEAKAPSRPASSTRPTIFDSIPDIVQLAFSLSIVFRRFARRAHPFITACAAGDVPCLLALFHLELYATKLTCTYIPAPQAPSAPSAPPSNHASQNQFEPRPHAMVACLRRLSALLPAKCHRCGGEFFGSGEKWWVQRAMQDAGYVRMHNHHGHWWVSYKLFVSLRHSAGRSRHATACACLILRGVQ